MSQLKASEGLVGSVAMCGGCSGRLLVPGSSPAGVVQDEYLPAKRYRKAKETPDSSKQVERHEPENPELGGHKSDLQSSLPTLSGAKIFSKLPLFAAVGASLFTAAAGAVAYVATTPSRPKTATVEKEESGQKKPLPSNEQQRVDVALPQKPQQLDLPKSKNGNSDEPKRDGTSVATPTVQAKRDYPSKRILRVEEIWDLARLVCPLGTPQYSYGMLGGFRSVGFLQSVLHIANVNVTKEEFIALACACNDRQFHRGGSMDKLGAFYSVPFGEHMNDPQTEKLFREEIELWTECCNMFNMLSQTDRDKIHTDSGFFLEAYFDEAEQGKDLLYPVTGLLSELKRYRENGALPHNRPAKPEAEIAREAQLPKIKSGDRVCNEGFLQLWIGIVQKVDDTQYTVKITYLNDIPFKKAPYKVGMSYNFTQSELKILTHMSIDSVLSPLRKRQTRFATLIDYYPVRLAIWWLV